jgi:glycosyltransferase involved in cell wall biosynthesis
VTICTIVIPTHNRPELLIRAVASALRSCPPDSEVLVVDDHSEKTAKEALSDLCDARLKVLRNAKSLGAAATRNRGVSQASGELIFFLDDDDEMIEDYCERVIHASESFHQAHWGYASIIFRQGEGKTRDTVRKRKRVRAGLVPANSRLRDRVAAISDGFWIRKATFLEVGGLDPKQAIDEDTDLCFRLLGSSFPAWYEPDPGMVVYRGYVPAHENAAQLTVATSMQRGLACYRRTYEKNAELFPGFSAERWFLGARFIRRAVKQGQLDLALDFVSYAEPATLRWAFMVFLRIKGALYRIKKAN